MQTRAQQPGVTAGNSVCYILMLKYVNELYPCYQVFMFVFICHSLILHFLHCSLLFLGVAMLSLVEGPVDSCSIWDRGVSLELVITVNYVIFPILLQGLVPLLTSKGKAFMAIRFYIFIFNIV